jgi:hypothetical protein
VRENFIRGLLYAQPGVDAFKRVFPQAVAQSHHRHPFYVVDPDGASPLKRGQSPRRPRYRKLTPVPVYFQRSAKPRDFNQQAPFDPNLRRNLTRADQTPAHAILFGSKL